MRSRILINFAGIFCCLLTVTTPVRGQQISDYRLFTGYGTRPGDPNELIIIRRFLRGSDTCYLTVSPQTLQTSVVNSGQVKVSLLPWNELKSRFAASAYIFALDRAELSRTKLQDAGIRKVLPLRKGIDLTIDLCPSRLPLDRELFTDLIKEMAVIEKPVPLAISVTGVWIREHPGDFRWLDSLNAAEELSILWINHSFNHHTSKKAPLTSNFLLAPGTDINSEVLDLELLLLKKNITPSVFFRFPGLVSDKEIYEKIIAFGLIPVGSDAWLAKGERPVNGSIVLIHANGNEPLGVRDFIRLLREEQSKAKSGQWELLDLRESLSEEEE
jgi:hypothetical protein